MIQVVSPTPTHFFHSRKRQSYLKCFICIHKAPKQFGFGFFCEQQYQQHMVYIDNYCPREPRNISGTINGFNDGCTKKSGEHTGLGKR